MKILLLSIMSLLISISPTGQAKAESFDWLDNLRIEATADPSGFRARLISRFQVGDAQVQAVISQVNSHSDAYMIFRLGELSHRPFNDVLDVYRTNQHQGWGRMAKNLGIKPGSQEFHALKQGHDLDYGVRNASKKNKGKKNKKNKGKSNKNKGKH
jgi:hypothetical protein